MGKFDNLLRKLNIDETYTKPILKKVIFDSVQQNTLYGVPGWGPLGKNSEKKKRIKN